VKRYSALAAYYYLRLDTTSEVCVSVNCERDDIFRDAKVHHMTPSNAES